MSRRSNDARVPLRIDFFDAPRWEFIGRLRDFADACLAEHGIPEESKSCLAVALAELCENAVKYGVGSGVRVRVALDARRTRAEVNVENAAHREQAERLKAAVRAVMEGDALQRYREWLLAAVARPDGDSKLGLARVRWEGRSALRVRWRGGCVSLVAEHTLAPAARQGGSP